MNSIGSILFLLAALLMCTNAKPMSDEQMQMVQTVMMNCKSKEGPSDSDVVEVQGYLVPSTKPGRCFNACLMEQFGLIVDGKFCVDGAVDAAKQNTGGDEKAVKVATEVANDCASITDEDRCELAAKVVECTRNAAMKRGADLNMLMG